MYVNKICNNNYMFLRLFKLKYKNNYCLYKKQVVVGNSKAK